MTNHNHRAECREPECVWVRRENCAECLEDLIGKHRRETGHRRIESRITSMATADELIELIGLAQPSVLRAGMKRRGW